MKACVEMPAPVGCCAVHSETQKPSSTALQPVLRPARTPSAWSKNCALMQRMVERSGSVDRSLATATVPMHTSPN